VKRILLATDLTVRSDRAAARARQLRTRFGAALTVLHVLDADLPEDIQQRRRQEARDLLERAFPGGDGEGGPETSIQVASGVEHEVIESRGREHDLIVLGTHRARFRDAFIGTTSERILRRARRPVLVVRDEALTPYGRVAVGVDFSDAARRAITAAADLAGNANFVLVHALDVPYQSFISEESRRRAAADPALYDAMDRLAVELPEAGDIRRLVRVGEPVPTLQAVVQEVGADLLAVGTQGRGAVGRALLGSVAERMLATLPCDTLAVPPV